MSYEFNILIEVWPYHGVPQDDAGQQRQTFKVKADDISGALDKAKLIATGICTSPKVWQAPIFEIRRADRSASHPAVSTMSRPLKHGEYQRGDRVRYTARSEFSNHAWFGRTGIITGLNGILAYVRFDDDKDRDVTCYVASVEHEILPQLQVGDEVECLDTGVRLIVERIGSAGALVCRCKDDGSLVAEIDRSKVTLVVPAQHREAGHG